MTVPVPSSPTPTPPLTPPPPVPPPGPGAPPPPPIAPPGASGAPPVLVDGTTDVLDGVIAKVAAIAARGVPGVVALGGGGAQLLGAARRSFTGDDTRERESSAGVRVEREDRAARLAMEVVIEYGAGAQTLVRALRRAVRDAVEQMVDVRVVALDVVIVDVRLPGEPAVAG